MIIDDYPELIPLNNELDKLKNLSYYLNYSVPTFGLYAGSFFWGIFLFIAIIAAIIFTPYMLKILYQTDRKKWVFSFVIIIGIPILLSVYFMFTTVMIAPIFRMISVGIFFLYCFSLKSNIRNWISDIKFKIECEKIKINKQRLSENPKDLSQILGINNK